MMYENDFLPDVYLVKTKRSVQYDQITAYDLNILDIANSLSQTNRYNGNTLFPYSVAQHSCHLYDFVPYYLRKAALLHDVAECFIGDLPYPMKKLCPLYEELDDSVTRLIFNHYDVDYENMEMTKPYDREMYYTESYHLQGLIYKKPPLFNIPELYWREARDWYLELFLKEFGRV